MLNNSLGRLTTVRASDDRLNGARSIGQLNGSRVFRDSVGLGDKVDFYSFKLSSRSSFNLALNKLKNNVDVSLIQNGKTLAQSTKGGKKPEAINTNLEAGTYFIKVSQKSGNSKYNLTLNAASDSGSNPIPVPPIGSRFLSFEGGISRLDPISGKMSILYKRDPAQVAEKFTDIAAFGNEIFTSTSKGLYKLDATTGTPSFVGNLSGNDIQALGFTPSGELYGVGSSITDQFGTTASGLFLIDRTNGTTLTVGAADLDFSFIQDIAYDATSGRFLAFSASVLAEDFYTIDLTGNIQKVNSLVPTYGGLAFDNGRLYAYGSVNNQEEVSPIDGGYINTSNKQLVFDPLQPMGALGYITGAA
jgi:Bacterial pre-peptidase C-terminal domain